MRRTPDPTKVAAQLRGYFEATGNRRWRQAAELLETPIRKSGRKQRDDAKPLALFAAMRAAAGDLSNAELARRVISQTWPTASERERVAHAVRLLRKIKWSQ